MTELQREESKSGRSRKSLEESLALFQEAYSLLLRGSGLDKMNEPPDHGEMEKQVIFNLFLQFIYLSIYLSIYLYIYINNIHTVYVSACMCVLSLAHS